MAFALLTAWLLAGEPGTQLHVFGEPLPDRGPIASLAPPLRLADLSLAGIPVAELSDDERALLLRRARLQAGERGLFADGPKDPWRAAALSGGAMACSIVFPPLWIVAGSVGQAYAGNWLEAGLMTALRLGFGIWIAAEGIALLGALSNSATLKPVQDAATNFNVASAVGGTVILAANAVDLVTVFGVAQRANARWEERVLGGGGAIGP